MMPAFEAIWAPYLDVMLNFISIRITQTELILSPAYDVGHTTKELRKVNLEKLSQID